MAIIEPIRAKDRLLSSWVAGFLEYTDGITSPVEFRRWAAITSVAAACERRLYAVMNGTVLFPNLYVFLCGPPGIGKSRAFHRCESLFRSQNIINIAPVNVTKASFVDTLYESYKGQFGDGYSSLFVAVGELSALLPGYDTDFLNTLTYLFDGEHYEEKRRSANKHLIIDNPSVTLLAGTTPGFLGDLLPLQAWNQGFMARVIIVFSDLQIKNKLNLLDDDETKDLSDIESALKHDFLKITEMTGRVQFSIPAAKAMQEWDGGLNNDPPAHPRLLHYCTRRTLQLVKLCVIAAVDRGAMLVSLDDFHTAHNWLAEAESQMADVFKAMTHGGDSVAIDDCYHWLQLEYVRTDKPVPSFKVKHFLRQRVPLHSVERAFQVMKDTKMFLEDMTGCTPTGEKP